MDLRTNAEALELTFAEAYNQGRIPVETYEALQARRLRLTDAVLYAKREATGFSGYEQLIKSSDSEIDGVRNIHNAILKPGELFLIKGISFSWYQGPAENAINNYVLGRKIGSIQIDKALQNSMFVIKQNSKTLLEQPVEMLLPYDLGTTPAGNEEMFKRLFPYVVITDQSKFELALQMPEEVPIGGTPTTDEIWVNAQLVGVKAQPKS